MTNGGVEHGDDHADGHAHGDGDDHNDDKDGGETLMKSSKPVHKKSLLTTICV